MNSFSLVVSVMNRTDRLKIMLDTWLRVPFIQEVVIVDWSSTPAIYDDPYLKKCIDSSVKLKLVRMEGQDYFNISRANNLGYDFCNKNNTHFCKVDVDCLLLDASIFDICFNSVTNKRPYFFTGDFRFDANLTGVCFMKMSDFCFYNENLIGWGYDDIDLYSRLQHNGLKRYIVPGLSRFIHHMFHDDVLRTENYELKDKDESNKLNRGVLDLNYKRVKNYEIISEDKLILVR